MNDKLHNEEIIRLSYTIWRLKHALKTSKRLDSNMNQMKPGSSGANGNIFEVVTMNGTVSMKQMGYSFCLLT